MDSIGGVYNTGMFDWLFGRKKDEQEEEEKKKKQLSKEEEVGLGLVSGGNTTWSSSS